MNNVFDIPTEFIEYSLVQAIEASDGVRTKYDGDLKNIYFAGQGLCLDTMDEFGQLEVIKISHDKETFGFFSGHKQRRLLSIKAIRLLETLMQKNGINYSPKFA